MKKRWSRLLFILLSFLVAGCAAQMPQTVYSPVDLNPKLQNGQMVQKVDSFLIINDLSFSMSDYYAGSSKLMRASDTIKHLNRTIPDLKLEAALRSFGYIEGGGMENSKRVYGMTPYTKGGLEASLGNQGRSGGQSPLSMGIDGATGDLKDARGRLAVIIISDGEDMNDVPVQAAERMKGQYGDRLCIYTIQMGNHPGGKKILQRIAEAGKCGFYVSGDDLGTSQAMGDYVEKVFLEKAVAKVKEEPVVEQRKQAAAPVDMDSDGDGVLDSRDKCPDTPKGTVVNQDGCPIETIRLDVEFDTGKSNIKAKYHNEIKKLADYMNENPQVTAVIEGHTDNVGKHAKNMRLSQDRANSIKNYLVKKFGISSARLKATGFGPDRPIADNDTVEGRQKNRRVQAVIDKNGKADTGVVKKAEKKPVKKSKKVKKVKKTKKVK